MLMFVKEMAMVGPTVGPQLDWTALKRVSIWKIFSDGVQ